MDGWFFKSRKVTDDGYMSCLKFPKVDNSILLLIIQMMEYVEGEQ